MNAPFVYSDGGRAAAGFEGDTYDCVTRAVVNFRMRHRLPSEYAEAYVETYAETVAAIMADGKQKKPIRRGSIPGVPGNLLPDMLKLCGARSVKVPGSLQMPVGHFARYLPDCLVYVPGHLTAVAGGRVLDTWDCRRRMVRMVWVDLGDQKLARRVMRQLKSV